jgi:hypothetical protein
MQNATQQIGGALGLATLVTLALRRATSQIHQGVAVGAAETHGYVFSYRIAAILCIVGGVLVVALLEHVAATPRQPGLEIEEAITTATTG